jgi:alkylation response protein AidB-like acyl-CoA dehydrogenase
MDFAFTPEQAQFRRDLQAFFAEERVQAARERLAHSGPREDVDMRPIHRWLGERGWLAVNWPEQYGGCGKTSLEAAIVQQELVRHGFPDLLYVVNICYIGSFLLLAGSDYLKQTYLPRMARAELCASTLYSEPGVGSDLSALNTRAHFDGQVYRLYGKKIYSQTTQFADYALVAARTADGRNKYEGITLFFVPLKAPGVQVQPVLNLSDDPFSDVVFDGVELSPEHVIPPLHGGWPLLNAALSIERTGLEAHLKMRSWLDLLIARARETGRLSDPCIAEQIIALDTQVEAGGLMAWRMIAKQARAEFDDIGSAMSKWYNTELGRAIVRLGAQIEGLSGLLSRGDPQASLGGRIEAAYRECPGLTLSAGTSEIMLYTIAAAHLKVYQ